MKYRKLTNEELEELRPEFIQFLVSNGIDAPRWEQIKKESPNDAELYLEKFSDVAIEKSLSKIFYIEHSSSSDYKIFHFSDSEAHLIALKSDTFDLQDRDQIAQALQGNFTNLTAFQAKKSYRKTREEELFDLLNKGCTITDDKMYNLLKTIIK